MDKSVDIVFGGRFGYSLETINVNVLEGEIPTTIFR